MPRDEGGHRFVVYADSCSGVPGHTHEENLIRINDVIASLDPAPQFICFPGDEIQGLTGDEDFLKAQWSYWLDTEMAWLDREKIPLYHTTGNHTTYNPMSERVFREVLDLPRNGPPDQIGLSYYVRRENLLMVFVNTLFSGRGGEGRVEHTWLDRILTEHADCSFKLVFGHHPVHAVNGFSGVYQRNICPEDGSRFWEVLVRHGVTAYVCSHILAFDVQVHEGVLQILTAGAGTADRMPEGIEYLHCVQAALDQEGLRYQVLDGQGVVREWLTWPLKLPPSDSWRAMGDEVPAPVNVWGKSRYMSDVLVWKIAGITGKPGSGAFQTLLQGVSKNSPGNGPVRVGLAGVEQRFCMQMSRGPGKSPHFWHGPALPPGVPFEIHLACHAGMGPGGVLWRAGDNASWSSMAAASPWGLESVNWPNHWITGHRIEGPDDSPFLGINLNIATHMQSQTLSI